MTPTIPYLRRRNTPAQLRALNQLFETTRHPTRAQRQALANDIGLELKSVTNWFQNRRQTTRKKSIAINPTRSNTPLVRSNISLDCIATLSERPTLSTCSPLTPRKSNVQNTSSPSELWTHMLSSPGIPPSSPNFEETRLAALSSRARIIYPLEWACLKARQKKWADEDANVFTLDASTENLPSHTLHMTPQLEDVEAAITLLGFKTRA